MLEFLIILLTQLLRCLSQLERWLLQNIQRLSGHRPGAPPDHTPPLPATSATGTTLKRQLVRAWARVHKMQQARAAPVTARQSAPSQSTPTAVHRLSPELLQHIFRFLYPVCPVNVSAAAYVQSSMAKNGPDAQGDGWEERLLYQSIPAPLDLPDPRTLAQCLRVSRAWYANGVELLWRMPRFRTPQSLLRFSHYLRETPLLPDAKATSLAKRRRLLQQQHYGRAGPRHVRALDMAHWHNAPELPRMLSRADQHALTSIMTHITSLSLSGLDNLTEGTLALWLTSISSTPGLVHLDLTGCVQVTDATLQLLAMVHGRTLQSLSLRRCARVTDRGLYALVGAAMLLPDGMAVSDSGVGCLRLQHLDLSQCLRVTEKGVAKVASRLRLRSLRIVDCISMGPYRLPSILRAAGRQLESVGCNLPTVPDVMHGVFSALFALPQLRFLTFDQPLANTRLITSIEMETRRMYKSLMLALPKHCPQLISLELSSGFMFEHPFQLYQWLEIMPHLRVLRLCNFSNLTPASLQAINNQCGDRLLLLDLSRSSFTDATVIEGLSMPTLRGLVARNIPMKASSVPRLIQRCKQLEGMDVSGILVVPEDDASGNELPPLQHVLRVEVGRAFVGNPYTNFAWRRIGQEGCALTRCWNSNARLGQSAGQEHDRLADASLRD